MQLEQGVWGVAALGTLIAVVALCQLTVGRWRVRETGVVVGVLFAGLLMAAGGFLLSMPRYLYTGAIMGGAAGVGLLAGTLLAVAGRNDTRRS
jgi:membrane protein CcdC involved in cytochrome C biogenesis